jgi:hypothetical protein
MYNSASMYSTQNPPADPDPPVPPPPPPQLRLRGDREGEGGEADQARQSIPNRYINFTARSQMAYIYTCLMHVQHILFSTQVRKIVSRNVLKYIRFRRRKLLQRRGARGQSSYPQNGIIFNRLHLKEVSGRPWPD